MNIVRAQCCTSVIYGLWGDGMSAHLSAKSDHYTKHGLHMNKTGKDWLTRGTADIIYKLFPNQES